MQKKLKDTAVAPAMSPLVSSTRDSVMCQSCGDVPLEGSPSETRGTHLATHSIQPPQTQSMRPRVHRQPIYRSRPPSAL